MKLGYSSDEQESDEQVSSDFESDNDDFEFPKEGGMLLSDLFDEYKTRKVQKRNHIEATVNQEDYSTNSQEDGNEGDEEDAESTSEAVHSHSKLLNSVNKFTRSANQIDSQLSRNRFSDSHPIQGLSMELLIGNSLDTRIQRIQAPIAIDKPTIARNEREIAYESNKTNIDRWHTAVLSNRFSKTLDLAKDHRQFLRSRSLVQKFSPLTPFEKEMESITSSNGLNEVEIQQNEDLSLQDRNVSAEVLKQRQQDLAKINALMFFEQMKRHRINKIKSKAFRKSLRRKKSRTSIELDGEGEEKGDVNQYERIQERASLRHKNTSNWAKMAINRSHDKSMR